MKKKSLQNKLSYTQRVMESKINQNNKCELEHVKLLERDIENLSVKINSLNNENKDLNNLIALLQDEEVVTFQDGKYCAIVRSLFPCEFICVGGRCVERTSMYVYFCFEGSISAPMASQTLRSRGSAVYLLFGRGLEPNIGVS